MRKNCRQYFKSPKEDATVTQPIKHMTISINNKKSCQTMVLWKKNVLCLEVYPQNIPRCDAMKVKSNTWNEGNKIRSYSDCYTDLRSDFELVSYKGQQITTSHGTTPISWVLPVESPHVFFLGDHQGTVSSYCCKCLKVLIEMYVMSKNL